MQAHALNANQIIPGTRQSAAPASAKCSIPNFKKILSEQSRHVTDGNHRIASTPERIKQNAKSLALGKISAENPTVSDLLVKHPAYSRKCWSIIHNRENSHKLFNQIQPGTTVYIDPRTFEITWKNKSENVLQLTADHHRHFSTTRHVADRIQLSTRIHGSADAKTDLTSIGNISHENTTISSLLIKHPVYAEKCWQIIHSKINQDKPFNKLSVGTKILLNPETFELTWEKETAFPDKTSMVSIHSSPLSPRDRYQQIEDTALSDQLESAVRSYVGKPYAEMDCYELVVRGLKQLGIRYSGKNGLKEMLVQKALGDGLPGNSYLTGDGLIHTAGNRVFSKTITNPDKSDVSARSLLEEMKPYLNKGLILSFSTPTRGHMGIISNQNQTWTFINSGTMDHQMDSRLNQRRRTKGVGEERLLPEIRNWLRLASRRKEPLQISLGQISEKRLLAENIAATNMI